jgi:hypothetical protein
MYLGEDYNSPQSVYWCFKAFIVAGLPDDDHFWTSAELRHPLDVMNPSRSIDTTTLIKTPSHILCNTREHHFLLSSGQSTKKNHKAREAKYGKFAYSSAFGFSVPVGSLLDQIAPDSTICLSADNGESWKVQWEPDCVSYGETIFGGEKVPTIISTWKPWKYMDFKVRTTLVAPSTRWPGWHIRMHEMEWLRPSSSTSYFQQVRCVEGGFAVSAETTEGITIYEQPCNESTENKYINLEGWWENENGCLVVSGSGASGVIDMAPKLLASPRMGQDKSLADLNLDSCGVLLKPHANTNLIVQRSLIPTIQRHMNFRNLTGIQSVTGIRDDFVSIRMVTGVFAVEKSASYSNRAVWDMWQSAPIGEAISSLLE